MYCKNCGKQIPDNSRFCNNCGFAMNIQQTHVPTTAQPAANKKDHIIKIVAAVGVAILAIYCIGSLFGGFDSNSVTEELPKVSSIVSDKSTEPPVVETKITYTHYDVVTLFDELDSNAMRAEQTHQDEYVEIEGYIHNFDSDGKYISVGSVEDDYDHYLDTILCSFTTDEQREQAMEMNKYDHVVIRGKITTIGEIMGYCLDIDEIVQ